MMTQRTPVITRIAPSPTGFMHIGTAFIALFNWLYAKSTGGRFLLRIEDTDRERSTQEAVEAIFSGLKWLELEWDDEPVFQFARQERHREVAQHMLDSGNAYRCYCSPEELALMRETARSRGEPVRYDGTWRDRDPSEAPRGVAPVIRLKAPKKGQTVIEDKIMGTVTVDNEQIDDMILLRSNGTPTYMLSAIVDDHDMGITHVIRGDDHLTNAARQNHIYSAMNWDIPVYAHVPLIHGPDGARLSKRHGALGIDVYRDRGYLPEAMRNYLIRLGWSHGDDEIFSTRQAIEWFGLENIGKSPSRFDFAKLESLNAHYIRQMDDTELARRTHMLVGTREGWHETPGFSAAFEAIIPALKERSKTLVELAQGAHYLRASRPLDMTEQAQKILNEAARNTLCHLLPALENTDWKAEPLEAAIRNFATTQELKFGKVAQPLRAALTGTNVSPAIYDVLVSLGRNEALARIADQASGAGHEVHKNTG